MKIAIVFPGQGSQYTGMGNDIYNSFDSAKHVYEKANNVLKKNVVNLCHNISQEELNKTENTQIALLTTMMSYYSVIEKYEHLFDAFAGFSLGEYAALVSSKVLTFEKSIEFVNNRAMFMSSEVSPGKTGMLAVLTKELELIDSLIEDIGKSNLSVANYNCPGQIVVSGYIDAINELKEKLKIEKVRSLIISVSIPAHCDILRPVALKMEKIMNIKDFKAPVKDLYMNVDGLKHNSTETILKNIIDQIYMPVQWQNTLINMWNDGIDTYIECGPGNTLTGFIKRTLSNANVYSVNDINSLSNTIKFLEGIK